MKRLMVILFVALILNLTGCGKDPYPGYQCPDFATCCHDTNGNAVLCKVIHPSGPNPYFPEAK